MKYTGDLYAKIGRKYLKLEMTSADVDNLEFENKKLKQIVEDNKQGYRSVKDALPPSDGLFYDVMGILWNDNICGGYNYHRGQYQNGFFFFAIQCICKKKISETQTHRRKSLHGSRF